MTGRICLVSAFKLAGISGKDAILKTSSIGIATRSPRQHFSTDDKQKKQPFINKVYLAGLLATQHDFSKAKARRIVDSVFDAISDELLQGGKVKISGFGSFSVKTLKSTEIYNPQLGHKALVPERKAPKFKPAAGLKNATNQLSMSDSNKKKSD